MSARVLGITATTLRGATRPAWARLGLFALLICVPLSALLFGQGAPGRAIIARMVLVEGLRLALPLAAVVGGAFILRPGLKSGYALLPVRRDEWFLGASLAGVALLALAAALFATGALLTFASLGEAGRLVQPAFPAKALHGAEEVDASAHGQRLGISTDQVKTIKLTFERPEGDTLRGEVRYKEVIKPDATIAPGRAVPFSVRGAEVRPIARGRASFTAPMPQGDEITLEIAAIDDALIIGILPAEVHVQAASAGALASTAWLALAALAAAALCMTVTLLVRSLAGASTAALAGLLLLATLTLLPGLAPASQMAADRRKAMGGDGGESIEATLSRLPALLPDEPFDAMILGRTVGAGTLADAALRAAVALVLLPAGSILFRRRQITK
jgi:hypothetical protein